MRLSRHMLFSIFILCSSVLFFVPLKELLYFSTESTVYSYIPLIPLLSIFLLYSDRKTIFSHAGHDFATGGVLLISALTLFVIASGTRLELTSDCCLSSASLAIILAWIGGFVSVYGTRTFRNAMFPLLFLLFMVPLPDSILDVVIVALQESSFVASVWIFKIIGVKASTAGHVISLPRLEIEIAKECSGIRSSMSLFITSLLVGHFFLNTSLKKGVLALTAIPIGIFKNAVRIVVLSLCTIYVDEGFMSGQLHQNGGILFFILGLSLLGLITWLLRGHERLKTDIGLTNSADASP